MTGAVPDDIAADKQRQLAAQLLAAESELSRQSRLSDVHGRALDSVVGFIANAGQTYAQVDNAVRSSLNQAWFDHLYIDEDDQTIRVVVAARADLTEALRTAMIARADEGYRVIGRVGGSNVACR